MDVSLYNMPIHFIPITTVRRLPNSHNHWVINFSSDDDNNDDNDVDDNDDNEYDDDVK